MVRCLVCQIGTRLSRRKDLIGSRGVCALSEGAGSSDGIGLFAAVPQLDCGCCALTALLLSSRSSPALMLLSLSLWQALSCL